MHGMRTYESSFVSLMNNLWTRIAVGVVGIPLAIGIIWLGGWAFSIAVMIVSALALREFYGLVATKRASANQSVGVVWGVVLQAMLTLGMHNASADASPWVMLTALFFILGVLVTLTAELWRDRENAILNTGMTIMGVAFVSVCLGTLIVLREMKSNMVTGTFGNNGATTVLTLFVAVWACDTAAYFVGMRYGKHKLFPRVSPKKSWEGAIAGFAAALLSFAAMSAWLMHSTPLWLALLCGAAVGAVGQVGDLAESLLKRDATIKDSSQLIPGHGGFLDRFDSMLFAAPVLLTIVALVQLLIP